MKMRREAAKQERGQLLQWHPAFFAGLQIEFGNEAKYLSFDINWEQSLCLLTFS